MNQSIQLVFSSHLLLGTLKVQQRLGITCSCESLTWREPDVRGGVPPPHPSPNTLSLSLSLSNTHTKPTCSPTHTPKQGSLSDDPWYTLITHSHAAHTSAHTELSCAGKALLSIPGSFAHKCDVFHREATAARGHRSCPATGYIDHFCLISWQKKTKKKHKCVWLIMTGTQGAAANPHISDAGSCNRWWFFKIIAALGISFCDVRVV